MSRDAWLALDNQEDHEPDADLLPERAPLCDCGADQACPMCAPCGCPVCAARRAWSVTVPPTEVTA